MQWLNYHHLHYFWVVAREGSIARACEVLDVAQPTISAQVAALEKSVGEKLFQRQGRGLTLTETGRVVFRYADEIFTLGRELMDAVQGRPTGRPLRLVVGIADVLPKLIVYRLLEPALSLPEPVQILGHEGKPETLLAELSVHGVDLVLSDAPIGPGVKIRAFNHLLGECGVALCGAPDLAGTLRADFPRSLDRAPFLLPSGNTLLRRSLDYWFEDQGIRPVVVGEFADSALLKVFGQDGKGIFAVPTVILEQVQQQYRVELVGRVESVRERFYAISVERRLKHPAVVAISEAARHTIFRDNSDSGP